MTPWRRFVRRWTVAGLALLAHLTMALAAAAAAPGADGDLSAWLRDLPRPNLELIEEGVVEQLAARRESVEALIAGPEVPAADLGEAIGSLGGLYYLYDYVDLAERCFGAAERLEPKEPRWPYLLGLSARLDGDLASSEASFQRALELAPGDPATLIRLADAQLELGQVDRAEENYRAALAIDEARPGAHYGLGRIAAQRSAQPQAIASFERALELAPEATSIHHQIGMAYRALGELDAARRHLGSNTGGRLRVVDPIVASLGREIQATSQIFSAGTRALRGGDLEGAIRLFLEAREQRPEDHLVDYNLALAYLQQDRRAAALEALRTSIGKNPDFRNGVFNLGILLAEDGKLEEAEGLLGRAHRIDPDDELAHLEWATALARLGQPARAVEELAGLLDRAPQLAGARLRLAQLQQAGGDAGAAGENFRRVLGGDAVVEEVVEARLGLGRLADSRGDPAAAVEHYRAASELDPSAGSGLALAAALGRLGRFGQAADTFSAVILADPRPLEAHFGRAMALLLGQAHGRARVGLEASLAQHPESLPLRHLYARVLAASPDDSVRDGERALEVANDVFRRQQTVNHGETVAMALAETGRFAEAVDWQRRVVAEADRGGQSRAMAGARRRLAGYERGEPCRSPWKDG